MRGLKLTHLKFLLGEKEKKIYDELFEANFKRDFRRLKVKMH